MVCLANTTPTPRVSLKPLLLVLELSSSAQRVTTKGSAISARETSKRSSPPSISGMSGAKTLGSFPSFSAFATSMERRVVRHPTFFQSVPSARASQEHAVTMEEARSVVLSLWPPLPTPLPSAWMSAR